MTTVGAFGSVSSDTENDRSPFKSTSNWPFTRSMKSRKGVPSRFLHFPDENHWVLKPQNSKLWHDEVLAWLDRWTKR